MNPKFRVREKNQQKCRGLEGFQSVKISNGLVKFRALVAFNFGVKKCLKK